MKGISYYPKIPLLIISKTTIMPDNILFFQNKHVITSKLSEIYK